MEMTGIKDALKALQEALKGSKFGQDLITSIALNEDLDAALKRHAGQEVIVPAQRNDPQLKNAAARG